MIALLVFSGLGIPNDLLSLVDAESYFRSRQVPVTVGKMLELAGTQPSDAKGEVARLLAIRMLGDEPQEVQKEKAKIVKVLEPIANSKDSFARVYARRTLGRLGVAVAAQEEAKQAEKLSELFAVFPEKVSFVAGGRASGSLREGVTENPLRDFLKSTLQARDLEEFYKFAEAVGDLRLDSFAMGYFSGAAPAKSRVYVRLTGQGDHQRLVDFLKKTGAGDVKEQKGPGGERITLFAGAGHGPAVALLGDTEMLVAGLEAGQGNHLEILEEMLKVRAGGEPSVLKGALAEQLTKVSPQAFATVVGEIPQNLSRMFSGAIPAPERIRMESKPASKETLEIDFHGKFKTADEAKAFAEGLRALRDKGVAALQNPPPVPANIKVPPRTFELLRTALQGLQMEAKGDAATGSMQVSRDLIPLLPMMFFGIASERQAPMPQAAPVPRKR
jgi:hypothetical protein